MKKIKAWSLNVVWDDGQEELNIDVPDHIVRDIEYYLDCLEDDDD
jgi:hypothetical protein